MQLVKFRRKDTNEIIEFGAAPWAVKQIKRASGLVEDVCEHGVGHPNSECLSYIDELNSGGFRVGDSWGVHGCDGCCCKVE